VAWSGLKGFREHSYDGGNGICGDAVANTLYFKRIKDVKKNESHKTIFEKDY